MSREDVVSFRNLRGRIIDAHFYQNNKQLRITLKRGQSSGSSSDILSRRGPMTKDQNNHNNNHAYSRRIHYLNHDQGDCLYTPVRALNSYDENLIEDVSVRRQVVFVIASLAILLVSYSYLASSSLVSYLPICLILMFTSKTVLNSLYDELCFYIIEESLIFTKDESARRLRYNLDGAESQLVTNCNSTLCNYFIHRRICFKGSVERRLSLEELRICEIIRNGIFMYSFVVDHRDLNRYDCDNDDSALTSDILSTRDLRGSHKSSNYELTTSDALIMTSSEKTAPIELGQNHNLIFSELLPRRDCIEYILSRINEFSSGTRTEQIPVYSISPTRVYKEHE